jgi:hypothetical protein
MSPAEGLLFPRCRSVHTLGMRFPIDVVFLSWPSEDSGVVRVLDVRRQLPPGHIAAVGRITGRRRKRVAVAELVGGRATSLALQEGTELMLVPHPPA